MQSSRSSQTRQYEQQHQASQPVSDGGGGAAAYVATQKLEAALKRVSKQALQYEYQIKELEAKLGESLSNFRAIDSLLLESAANLQRNSKRADRALKLHVPHISRELDESMDALSDLAEALPIVRAQVANIRRVYDSGREKAQALVADLSWLNTDFYERWRIIIFTSTSPVSWRWKVLMRFIFTISFIMCSWLAWIALIGAYRAHKHRLVWGERLMS